MTSETLFIIHIAITVISAIIMFYLTSDVKDNELYIRISVPLLTTVAPLTTHLINFISGNNLVNSYGGYASMLASVILILFVIVQIFIKRKKRHLSGAVIGGLLLAPVFTVIFTIISSTNLFGKKTTNKANQPNLETISLEKLEKSIDKVKVNFNAMEDMISDEANIIDKVFKDIRTEIAKKNDELKSMRQRENELVNKINYYENLMSLNQDQIRAVETSLDSNSLWKGMVNFFLGVASSLFVLILTKTKLFKRLISRQSGN